MSYYSFNIKKGKYQIEMRSDDKYFARTQVGKLFESLLKVRGKLKVVLPPISKEAEESKEAKKQVIAEEPAPKSVKKEEEKPVKPVEEIKEAKEIKVEKIVEEKLPEPEPPKVEKVEVVEVIQEIEEEIEEESAEEPEEVPVEPEIIKPAEEVIKINNEVVEKENVENLFENILSQKTTEIEEKIEEPEETPPQKKSFSFKKIITEKFKGSDEESSQQKLKLKEPEEAPELENISENITKVLEEKIKNVLPLKSEEEPVIAEIVESEEEEEIIKEAINSLNFESMEELVNLKQPQSKLEYLLLTAYYLQSKENLFKYSLKQLNSKLMPFLGSLIDHSIIHNAVAHDFIEVVPDYSGTSDVTEYRLTDEGESYFLNG